MIYLNIPLIPIFIAVLVFCILGVFDAFAAGSTPGCDIFDVSPGCDLSGWMHLLLGDALIGVLLGILFHYLSHKTNAKIEKIIKNSDQLRKRRKNYAIQQLKVSFNGVLFTLGSVQRSINQYNKQSNNTRTIETDIQKLPLRRDTDIEKTKLEHSLQRIQNILIATNDTLEPDVTNQINAVVTFIGELSIQEKNGLLIFPKYHISKRKAKYIIEMLK